MPRPLALAHRGASAVEYENSRAAFRRARELGADGIELDVHATRDGTLVVLHDPVIPGHGRVAELPAATVTACTLPNGETIPTLAEVLPLVRGLDVWVEVKALEEFVDAVLLRTLADGPEPHRYGVHSFDHRIVRRLGEREPGLRRGVLLASRPIDVLPIVRAAGASVVWQQHDFVDRALVEALLHEQVETIAWTANDAEAVARLLATGLLAICTDHPERVRDARR